jgi:ribosome-associated toxin RatA of RatAB toxin-antitoxin module
MGLISPRIHRPCRIAVLLLGLAVVTGAPTQEVLKRPRADWADKDRLTAGDILVHIDDAGPFRGHVQAAIAIKATPREIWGVVTDCDKAPEFVPGVLSCERLQVLEPGRVELFRQTVKYSWYLPRLEYDFRLEYFPYEQLNFRRVGGSLKRLDGTWWLEPLGRNQTLVFYAVDLDPGFLMPQFVVRKALSKDLPKVLAALRQRVLGQP